MTIISSPAVQYRRKNRPRRELQKIIIRSAELLEITLDEDAANQIARRSRGTPRIANRLLRRVRDYAEINADGAVTGDLATQALHLEGVDELGLDRLDRLYLTTLADQYSGGPAGLNAIAATINEDSQTLEDVVEPFLLKIGLIIRTSAGRRVTQSGMNHAGLPTLLDPEGPQQASLL